MSKYTKTIETEEIKKVITYEQPEFPDYEDYKFIGCQVLFGGKGLYVAFKKMLSNIVESIKGTTTPNIPVMFFGDDVCVKFESKDGEFEYHSLKNEVSKALIEAGIVTIENLMTIDLEDDCGWWKVAEDEERRRYPIIAVVLDGTSLTARELHDLYVNRYTIQVERQVTIVETKKNAIKEKDKETTKSFVKMGDYRIDPEVCIVFADVLKYLGNGEVSASEYVKVMEKTIHYDYKNYLSEELDFRDEISLELVKEKPDLTEEHLPQLYEPNYDDWMEVNIDRDLDGRFQWVRRRNRYLRMKTLREEGREIPRFYHNPMKGDLITYYTKEDCDVIGEIACGQIHRIKHTPSTPHTGIKSRMIKIDGTDVQYTYLCDSIGSAYHYSFVKENMKKLGFRSVYAYAMSDTDMADMDTCKFSCMIVGPNCDYDKYDGTMELDFRERCRLYTVHLKSDICGFNLLGEHFSEISRSMDE